MYFNVLTTLTLLSGLASAIPAASIDIAPRQADVCFIVGNERLPNSIANAAEKINNKATCSEGDTTIAGVPDVTSGGQTFSKIDFSTSGQTPLEFSLGLFRTAIPLSRSNLAAFNNARNVYLATEAGIRSVGGQFEPIRTARLFIDMQIARIRTARGNPPKNRTKQVDQVRDRLLKNAACEDQALLDQVIQLATQLQ